MSYSKGRQSNDDEGAKTDKFVYGSLQKCLEDHRVPIETIPTSDHIANTVSLCVGKIYFRKYFDRA